MLEHIGSNRDYRRNLSLGLTHESFEAVSFINRPLDITFLLDTLEQKNSAEFQARLQLDRVCVIGRSLGGYTALAAAGATVDIERLQSQCDPEAEFTPDTVNMALLIQCREHLLQQKRPRWCCRSTTTGSLPVNRRQSYRHCLCSQGHRDSPRERLRHRLSRNSQYTR